MKARKIHVLLCLSFVLLLVGCSKNNDDVAVGLEALIIPIEEVSEEAKIYTMKVDKVDMEVIAVMASDGTIRTAFNTCQICYQSPAGRYKQQEDYLICQNCGNAFSIDEVEQIRGGCNPVPIMAEEKVQDDTTIKITKETMKNYIELFD